MFATFGDLTYKFRDDTYYWLLQKSLERTVSRIQQGDNAQRHSEELANMFEQDVPLLITFLNNKISKYQRKKWAFKFDTSHGELTAIASRVCKHCECKCVCRKYVKICTFKN